MMRENGRKMHETVNSWTDEQCRHRYAPGKWSAIEVIMHLIDSERIFSYRALRFARGDTNSLPGFDENLYADRYRDDIRTKDMIVHEMKIVRESTICLFESFSTDMLDLRGIASETTMTVRSIGEMIVGHEIHHKKVLEEKYFPK